MTEDVGAALRRAADLLTPDEAAAMLNIQASTLTNWRSKRIGPNALAVGERRYLYALADILEWLHDRVLVMDGLDTEDASEPNPPRMHKPRPLPVGPRHTLRDTDIRRRRAEGASLRELAAEYDLTPERISQICARVPGEGFFAGLTPEQKEAALAYRGPEGFGDPRLAR